MKNLQVKVVESCSGALFWFGIYDGEKELMSSSFGSIWERKFAAIRNAKAMAKRIDIPYSDEIIKQHRC